MTNTTTPWRSTLRRSLPEVLDLLTLAELEIQEVTTQYAYEDVVFTAAGIAAETMGRFGAFDEAQDAIYAACTVIFGTDKQYKALHRMASALERASWLLQDATKDVKDIGPALADDLDADFRLSSMKASAARLQQEVEALLARFDEEE